MHLSDLIRTDRLRGISWLVCILCLHGVSAGPAEVRTRALGELLSEPVFSAPATVIARNRPEIAAEIAARIVEPPETSSRGWTAAVTSPAWRWHAPNSGSPAPSWIMPAGN